MEDKGGSEKRGLFEREALPHVDALYSAALRLSRNPDDARDLLQETVLRAYRFFHQYTPGTNCRAWLLTILYNNFRNGYRGADREQVSLTRGRGFECPGGPKIEQSRDANLGEGPGP
jgi:RNA polymerase sigma-70 factor (ECF subfamily)